MAKQNIVKAYSSFSLEVNLIHRNLLNINTEKSSHLCWKMFAFEKSILNEMRSQLLLQSCSLKIICLENSLKYQLILYRGSYMSAHLLLFLINELTKIILLTQAFASIILILVKSFVSCFMQCSWTSRKAKLKIEH